MVEVAAAVAVEEAVSERTAPVRSLGRKPRPVGRRAYARQRYESNKLESTSAILPTMSSANEWGDLLTLKADFLPPWGWAKGGTTLPCQNVSKAYQKRINSIWHIRNTKVEIPGGTKWAFKGRFT